MVTISLTCPVTVVASGELTFVQKKTLKLRTVASAEDAPNTPQNAGLLNDGKDRTERSSEVPTARKDNTSGSERRLL